jgi:PAS domain S-box-containing protein
MVASNDEVSVPGRQMRTEDELRVSELKFRALFQGMPVPVYTWQRRGDDFVLVDHNAAADAITGGKIGDFVGMSATAMYPDRPDIVADISRCFEEKTSIQSEMVYWFKTTGERRHLVVEYAFVPPDLVLVQTQDVTQRVQAEESLRESELRLELAVAGSDGGLWSIDLEPDDPSHTHPDEIYLSPRLKGLIGYEDAEFPNSMAAWESHVHPEDLQRLRKASQKYRQGEIGRYEVEYRIRHKDGSIRWLRTTGRVERDEDGRSVRFAGIDWDITERKRAEEQVAYQAHLLANVNDAILATDDRFVVTAWNRAAEEIHGWKAEEAIGRMVQELIPTDFTAVQQEEALRALAQDGRYRVEISTRRKDGQPIEIEGTTVALRGKDGRITGYVSVNRDITERVQAQAELQKSEEKYRDLVEKTSDVIYAVDTGGVITYLNPAVEALIGLPPEQVVGQPFGAFIHPEDVGQAQGNVQDLLSGGLPGPAEYRVLDASGETRWIRVTSQPVVDEGQVTGFQGVLSDITDRKRAEARLAEATKAAERQRLAAELHDSVTQTLYSGSLIAQTMQRMWDQDSEAGRRGLAQLQRFLQGALAEMRTLLLELNPAALEAKELPLLLRQLADAAMVRTPAIVTTRVIGQCTVPNEVKAALYRIAQEALNNIVKYAGAQRVKVNLQCLEKRPGVLDGAQTILSIKDDGGGFDPEDPGAAGLGLGIMRDRAREIDATLTITSQPGKGTEVLVEWQNPGQA